MKNIWPFTLLLSLLNCSSIPDTDTSFESVQLEYDGGMQNTYWTIHLSVTECYLDARIYGQQDRYTFSLGAKEWHALEATIEENAFSQIPIRSEKGRVYDRGGSRISLQREGLLVQKNNAGIDFVEESYLPQFENVREQIIETTRAALSQQGLDFDKLLAQRPGPGTAEIANSPASGIQCDLLPVRVSGPAALHGTFEGPETATMPDGAKVQLLEIHHDWARILYQGTEGWTPLYNLPYPSLLVAERAVNSSPTHLLALQLTPHTGDGPQGTQALRIDQTATTTAGSENLWYDEVYPAASDQGLHYALYYTAIEEYPFLLYISGQTGDEISSPGALLLYNPGRDRDDRHLLRLRDGNRVASELIAFDERRVRIREAFHCQIVVESEIAFSADGFQRLSGRFADGSIFPKPAFFASEEERQAASELSQEITVFWNRKLKLDESDFFSMGAPISFELLEIDYRKELVKVRINGEGEAGWMVLDTVKNLEAVSGPFGGACDAG